MRLIPILLAVALVVEGIAWWWTHPTPAGIDQPVLVYRPPAGGDPATGGEPGGVSQGATASTPARAPETELGAPQDTVTPMPELVAKFKPSLRCTAGDVRRLDRKDGVTVHLAFFTWDFGSSVNVLEAYRHLPDQCMGSIGMKLIEKAAPRTCRIGGEVLTFDHTIFHDQGGVIVHAFKGTWVSGASNLLGNGLRGGVEQWRQLRWRAALNRFRPAYARVAQGAVRGIANADEAWQAFQDAMLKDLKFEPPPTVPHR